MVSTGNINDKLKVLEKVTEYWQPTSTIAKKLRYHWGVAMGVLGILCRDGYVDCSEIRRNKSVQYLWRRSKKEISKDLEY